MNIPYITIIILCISVVFICIKLDKTKQKQIDCIKEEFKGVVSFVESLKFRVYDHERQLLNKEGVFVPEDMGIFTFNLMWSMLDEETKNNLQKEYSEVCPSQIPLWKYVIYSYQFIPKIERKIELKKVESVDDLLNSQVKKIGNKINKIEQNIEEISSSISKMDSIEDDKESS